MEEEIFYRDSDKRCHLNYDVLLSRFLKENKIVRCDKVYYLYDAQRGIWYQKDLEDIQIGVARFLESETEESWTVSYKKQVMEKLKVATEEVSAMNLPDNKICLRNGVLDMERGCCIKQFDENYLFTNRLEVDFDRNAQAPLFEKFLEEVTCGKQLRKRTLEEFMGLALTKKIGRGEAMILKGAGNNGKSVYLNILCKLLGLDRWTAISVQELPNFGASVLPGKTLAVISEISRENSSNLMTTELKQLITGENMWCNIKYHEAKSIKPCVKVLILTNHNIGLCGDDSDGAIRRLFILPFEYYVSDDKVDLDLSHKLEEELSGILNLAVKGYRRLVRQNFVYSSHDESDKLIREILRRENPLRSFVKEEIVFSYSSNLSYDKFKLCYQKWCKENSIDNQEALDSKQVYAEVAKYYNIEHFKSGNKRGMKNIKLKNDIARTGIL